jgi:recombinational DNA repair ATPase RecF
MGIRIDRMKINRGGPLSEDFELQPGDLNLIYGHNETGKTYLVESLIRFLFRTAGKRASEWRLRNWDPSGRVLVSGLSEETVSFTKTGKKLEDYGDEGFGLPPDLSRLLVVKAGQTLLTQGTPDGVGEDILKDILSGERMLDDIQGRISKTLLEAVIQDGRPEGAQRGEIKDWASLKEALESQDALLEDTEEAFASGSIHQLRRRQAEISDELEALNRAKGHQAFLLHEELGEFRAELAGLPDEEKLGSLGQDLTVWREKRGDQERTAADVENLTGTEGDYQWAEGARGVYQEALGGSGAAAQKPVFLFIALALAVAAGVTGLLGFALPMVLCLAGAVGSGVAYYLSTRKAFSDAARRGELDDIRAQFQTRFGSDLTDLATLQARVAALRDDHARLQVLTDQLDRLGSEVDRLERGIGDDLRVLTRQELAPQAWSEAVDALKKNIRDVEAQIASKDRTYASLGIPESGLLAEDPGVSWDSARAQFLQEEYQRNQEELQSALGETDQLRARVQQATGSDETDWEALVDGLRTLREGTLHDYRDITADIIAKVKVKAAIDEFRQDENARIAEGLRREELTELLESLTGRYRGVRPPEDDGLILTTGEDEAFPLADLSTGAQERVHLALRIGFASMAMKGQRAFLILDDAFQHSDWVSRPSLVGQTLRLVEAGWQVFYFSMDDHIRDLFVSVGAGLGDRFRSAQLG